MPTRSQIQKAGLKDTREPGPLGALEFERILAAEPSVYKAAILDGVVVEIEQDLADASNQLGYQGEIAAPIRSRWSGKPMSRASTAWRLSRSSGACPPASRRGSTRTPSRRTPARSRKTASRCETPTWHSVGQCRRGRAEDSAAYPLH